ncbi:growth/differentiation factor 11-like [Antedon mediterranea]|uniref:growth/differentiation factor 11-like n=1 Tax=Antedon mediterranea TaxID=105859 RepID=UPI003AF5A8DE
MYSHAIQLVCILLIAAGAKACLREGVHTERQQRGIGENDSKRPRKNDIGKALELATKQTIMKLLSIDESFINELNRVPPEQIPEDKLREYDNLVLKNQIQSGKTDILFNITDEGHSPSLLESRRSWRSDGSTERLYFHTHFAEARGRKRRYITKTATLTFYVKALPNVNTQSIEIGVFEFFNTSLTARGHVKSQTVPLINDKWQKFSIDITDLVDDWLKFPRLNFGIEIGTTTGEPLNNYLHLYSRRSRSRKNNSNEIPNIEQYPVITIELQKRSRLNRDTQTSNLDSHGMCSKNQIGCCRKNYTIDFEKLNFGNLILRPTSVNMFYCHGACGDNNIFMNDMHTLFKHYVHEKDPELNGPCCVPTRFNDFPVIIRTSERTLEVMVLENLIANDCKCS